MTSAKGGQSAGKKTSTPLKNQSLLMNFMKPTVIKEAPAELKVVESETEIIPPSSKSN
jgi:hypothetical protein